MSLVQDVPSKLKEFARQIDNLAYVHGYNEVFIDFVNYVTGGLLVAGDKPLAEHLQEKYSNRYAIFNELLMLYIKAMADELAVNSSGWFDGLGIIYEIITSRYKSSLMGQFFTPPNIVDLMARLTNPADGNSVVDCCSGSGRMLLASHSNNLSGMKYGADLDPICAKMTAINLALHGCQGEATCMNSITLEWYFGYFVNPYFKLGSPPIPHLLPISEFSESIFYAVPQQQQGKPKTYKSDVSEIVKNAPLPSGQLSLF